MKFSALALALLGSVTLGGAVFAQTADDAKWVAKCVSDNAGASVGPEVVLKYCTCMNSKMDSNETLSISAWEQSHPTERKACEAVAGWK